MKTIKILAVCFAALIAIGALNGCATRVNYAQQDHQACESLGIYWGTAEYVQCRGILYQERQATYRQTRANNLMLYNTLMMNRPKTCTQTGYTTTCY